MSPSRTSPIFEALPPEAGGGLRLVGELDLATVGALREMLDALPRDGQGGVVLDLADLSFMDSSGLQAFIQYAATLDGAGPLVLENTPGHVRRLFELTSMDEIAAIELRGGDERG